MHPRFRIAQRLAAGLAATLPLVGMVAACDPENRVETASTAVGSTSVGGTAGGTAGGEATVGRATFVPTDTAPGPTAAAELSDANIVALLDRASVADSSAGALASAKATSEQVRRFARVMMADHHQLRLHVAALSKRLRLTPQPAAYDPVTPRAQHAMAALESAPKGADFDRIYIQLEIAAHREVLDLAEQVQEAAGSPELKAMIERARPLIERHLEHAQAIETALRDTA